MAFLVLLLAAVTGVMLLYTYRAQSPSGPVGTPDAIPMMGVALLLMLLPVVVPMAVLFLVVYAVRRGCQPTRSPTAAVSHHSTRSSIA